MRTVPLVLAALALAGCDPCAGYAGTTFVDEAGLPEGELARLVVNFDATVAAMGPDRVCIDRVQILAAPAGEDVAPRGQLFVVGAAWSIELHPTANVADLRTELCRALDLSEGIEAQARDLFRDEDFATVCGQVFPRFTWHDEIVAACGESPLSRQEEFMADVVFPVAKVGRMDGALVTSAGAPVELPGLLEGGGVAAYARLGEGMILALDAADAARPTRVVHVDLDSGAVTPVLSIATDVELYGGAEGAVVVERTALGGSRLHVVDAETLGVTSVRSFLRDSRLDGAVFDGALHLTSSGAFGTSVEVVDLGTGVVTELPFPVSDEPLQVNPTGLVPVPGGFVLAYGESALRIEEGVPIATIGDGVLARWSDADGAWTELTRGFRMTLHGATTDGRLVGSLAGAGEVLGAYAYEDDVLDVSVDVCLADTGPLDVVVGNAAWDVATDGDDVVLTPFAL